jgi:hypothetical protein
MGGYGSSRWGLHTKKLTVEDCRHIDTQRWVRDGIIAPHVYQVGGWQWSDGRTGEKTASIVYQVETQERGGWVRLSYTATLWHDKEHPRNLDYRIPLVTTPCHFGGVRWWFICLGGKEAPGCGRRVRKLYLPPGGLYFLCRHCYDLAYRRAQEHDKRSDAYRHMSLEDLTRLVREGPANVWAIGELMERAARIYEWL